MIAGSTIRGTVAGDVDVGGVVGVALQASRVHECTVRNAVRGARDVGGLAGRLTGSAVVTANHVLSIVEGHRDVGSLVGWFDGGVLADNHTHGVVTQYDRALAAAIGRRGLAKNARYIRGPYINPVDMANLDEALSSVPTDGESTVASY